MAIAEFLKGVLQACRTRIHKVFHMHLCSSMIFGTSKGNLMWPQCCLFASGKAILVAVASKTLKITHLDLASEAGLFDSWAQLGASSAEAWARFPDRFGTGRLGCWHQVAGFCLVMAHQKLQPSNQGTEVVSFACMIDTEYYRRSCARSSVRGGFDLKYVSLNMSKSWNRT